jgi:hypothetical protein
MRKRAIEPGKRAGDELVVVYVSNGPLAAETLAPHPLSAAPFARLRVFELRGLSCVRCSAGVAKGRLESGGI